MRKKISDILFVKIFIKILDIKIKIILLFNYSMHKSKQSGWIYIKNKENNKKSIIINNDNNSSTKKDQKKSNNNTNNNINNNQKNKKKNNDPNKDTNKNINIYKKGDDKDPFRFELCDTINDNINNKLCNDNKNDDNHIHNENFDEIKEETIENSDNVYKDGEYECESDEKYDSNESENNNDKNSFKKILCYNIIYNGSCKYGDKCLYAHSLEDQNINKMRKEVYDILKCDSDLSAINLKEDYELYKTMLEMTKYCKNCNNNMCKGGYNCKSGVYDKKYCICINDLNYGYCHNYNCNFIHLSKRGLKPYYDNKKKQTITKSQDENNTLFQSNEEKINNIFCELQKNINNTNNKSDKSSDSDSYDYHNFRDNDKTSSDKSDIDFIENTEECDNTTNNTYSEYIEIVCNRSIFRKIT
jgi:hypothetical protein